MARVAIIAACGALAFGLRGPLDAWQQVAGACRISGRAVSGTQRLPGVSVLGKSFKVSKQRGEFVESSFAPLVVATVHPSSILRAQDDESRREEMERFVADLKRLAGAMSRIGP